MLRVVPVVLPLPPRGPAPRSEAIVCACRASSRPTRCRSRGNLVGLLVSSYRSCLRFVSFVRPFIVKRVAHYHLLQLVQHAPTPLLVELARLLPIHFAPPGDHSSSPLLLPGNCCNGRDAPVRSPMFLFRQNSHTRSCLKLRPSDGLWLRRAECGDLASYERGWRDKHSPSAGGVLETALGQVGELWCAGDGGIRDFPPRGRAMGGQKESGTTDACFDFLRTYRFVIRSLWSRSARSRMWCAPCALKRRGCDGLGFAAQTSWR